MFYRLWILESDLGVDTRLVLEGSMSFGLTLLTLKWL